MNSEILASIIAIVLYVLLFPVIDFIAWRIYGFMFPESKIYNEWLHERELNKNENKENKK